MPSQIEIVNAALIAIGADTITSLSQPTKEAKTANAIYNTILDAVLTDTDWTFARKRQALALLSDTYDGWDYAYQYPTDCLCPRKIYDESGDTNNPIRFEVGANDTLTENVILTDQEDAILIYTARVTNPQMYTPIFIKALIARLAAELAIPIKGKATLHQSFTTKYLLEISHAAAVNGNAEENQKTEYNTFVEARS